MVLAEGILIAFVVFVEHVACGIYAELRDVHRSHRLNAAAVLTYNIELGVSRESVIFPVCSEGCREDDPSVGEHGFRSLVARKVGHPARCASLSGGDVDVLTSFTV